MSIQEVEYLRSRRRWRAYSNWANFTVSGASGSRILAGTNSEYVSGAPPEWSGGGSTSAGIQVVIITYSNAGPASVAAEYNPDMVAEILRADAAQPEGSFNNVVDMLDWLNRD